MRSKIKIITSIMAVILIMLFCIPATSAAEDELIINSDATVKVGDTVTYTMYLADCDEPIIGIQMYVFFNSENLSYVQDSLDFEKFSGVVYNQGLDGKVPVSWTNISDAADFSSKAMLLSLDFKVIKGGECTISDFVSEMYGDDMTYVKNYTFTYDISVNDEKIVSDKPVVVNTDEDIISEYQGAFINYDDGMGENSPNQNSHSVIVGTQVVTGIVNATRIESVSDAADDNNSTAILIIVGVIVVILAIVAIIIVRKRDDAKNKADHEVENK